MAILPIAKLGNPIFARWPPRWIRAIFARKNCSGFIDDLFETMLDEPGIGLAAPQVSRSIQLVVMGCEGRMDFPNRPHQPQDCLLRSAAG